MTPRDQIQEHAKTLSAEMRTAIQKFHDATGGLKVDEVYVSYVDHSVRSSLISADGDYILEGRHGALKGVSVRIADWFSDKSTKQN
ncbi:MULTISPECIES: hypothetical protein [Delftia]|uniref:hypothetical protein n=1 Tax=Delftia TaxID=80865 RepID=UPI000648C192|nr:MULTISPECIES: hypothetical protein [Delftia]MDH1824624.1 hypothetical protein [Delftia tsuruhatensis]